METNSFISSAFIGGYSNIITSLVSTASGGSFREDLDSIKFSTASQFATQNRLVTFKDYETFLKRSYPNIDSLTTQIYQNLKYYLLIFVSRIF
jgi:hypothetical protein